MRKPLLLSLALLLFFNIDAQTIKPGVFGQNAWFINNATPDLSAVIGDVKASGVQCIRVGGIDANWNAIMQPQMMTLVTQIKSTPYNFEPIVQVPFNGDLTPAALATQASTAASMVSYLNGGGLGSPSYCKYWIISNEPDGKIQTPPWGFQYNGDGVFFTQLESAQNIANYIKALSMAMKNADPNIQIIGPELASFGNDPGWRINKIMNFLISDPNPAVDINLTSIMGQIPSGPASTKYFVDFISFHPYASLQPTLDRPAVIIEPTMTDNGFKNLIVAGVAGKRSIVDMINALPPSANRNISNLKIACTEFNIGYESGFDESTPTGYLDMINGFDNRSFIAGQWLSEVYSEAMRITGFNTVTVQDENWVEFMNFWSIKEGAPVGSVVKLVSFITQNKMFKF